MIKNFLTNIFNIYIYIAGLLIIAPFFLIIWLFLLIFLNCLITIFAPVIAIIGFFDNYNKDTMTQIIQKDIFSVYYDLNSYFLGGLITFIKIFNLFDLFPSCYTNNVIKIIKSMIKIVLNHTRKCYNMINN